MRIWNHRTRAQTALLSVPGQLNVNALAFTPNGQRLVTGGLDGTTRIWDVATGRLLLALPPIPVLVNGANVDPRDRAINCLAVSPDGKLVAFTDGQHPGICPQHHTQPGRLRDKIRLEERPGKSHAAEAGVAQRVET